MHLSTHHLDLNNLFTISSLDSHTFNQVLNQSHLHLKNQNPKSRSHNQSQRPLHLYLFLWYHQKIHQKPLLNLPKKTKAQWNSIIIILSKTHLLTPLSQKQSMSQTDQSPTRLPLPLLFLLLVIITSINVHTLLLTISEPLFPPKDRIQKNISSHPDWISVPFRLPPLNNMSLWKFPQN